MIARGSNAKDTCLAVGGDEVYRVVLPYADYENGGYLRNQISHIILSSKKQAKDQCRSSIGDVSPWRLVIIYCYCSIWDSILPIRWFIIGCSFGLHRR